MWCVFVDDGSGEDHYRILSTHATRDGAAVSANQVNQAVPKSGMVLDQEALLDGTGRWGELPYKSRGVRHPVEGWE